MAEFENDDFVVRVSYSGLEDRICIANMKQYGEGMYITEDQIDGLIAALNGFKKQVLENSDDE